MSYLNFDDIKPHRCIYRITTVRRFVEGLQSRDNVLVRPGKWDDPFEGYILNAYGVLPDGAMVAFRLRHNYFGQCWSLHRETDLMWRAYSRNEDSVKLRVRADRLHDSLHLHLQGSPNCHAYLGRVSYQRGGEFRDTLRSGCHFGSPSESQARTLLVKRYGFRSEREVRLIAYAEQTPASDILRYPVDWNALVVEAVLNPRMSAPDVAKAKSEIRAAGYLGRVIQSGLYKRPAPLKFGVDLKGAPRTA